MILRRHEFIWNHGWHGFTRMKNKAMLARPVPGLAAFLQAHFQASLKMVLQKLRSIRFANDQHCLMLPDLRSSSFYLPKRGALIRAAGPKAERLGDVFLQSRASSLVKGFKNSAPAWLAKRSPAAALLSVYICVIRG